MDGLVRVGRKLGSGVRTSVLAAVMAAAGAIVAVPHEVASGQQTAQRPGWLVRLEQAQPALLQAEVSRLAPHRKGETDIYAIGIAGWPLDVFHKEVDGGLAAIGNVLPIKNRTIRLINHPATDAKIPLATAHNIVAAVHAVGSVMNKQKDVLVLLLTSHGDRTGFGLRLPDAIVDMKPTDLAGALDREGIKNRVVIISACFSGIFVPALRSDDTIVMTAADSQHTSFGCAPENDWTYFGDALFRQSMQPGTDFQHAFAHARVLIEGWELMDHAKPSNPQGYFGPALVAKLAPFFRSEQASGR